MSAMNRTKLHIKNLPKKLSVSDRESFLKQFNPTEVICFPDNGRMVRSSRSWRQRAFAKFADEASAKMALETLQNFVLLGSKLRVEFSIPKPDSSLEATEIAEEEEESQDDSLRSTEELDESAPSPEMIKRIADLLATNRSFYIGVVKLMRVLGISEDSPRLSNPSPGLVNSLVQNRNLLPYARKRKSDVLITGVLGELQAGKH
ncbi:hypothetical protein HDE_02550 [Halotydeus destructor]|nr:hypothetical protein HDE_02550 [Halotydeus destructor]